MRYNDFIKSLVNRGCILHRTGGKHLIYRHPNLERNLVIPKAKSVSFGIVKECDKLLSSIGA